MRPPDGPRLGPSSVPCALVATIAALAVFVGTFLAAEAAALRSILVYGGGLPSPLILSDWNANADVLLGDPIFLWPGELDGRPYLDLALFWGPEWNAYLARGEPIETLRPEQANQHGRFYPLAGDSPPIITLDNPSSARVVSNAGLQALAQARVSTRIELPPSAGDSGLHLPLPFANGLLLVAALILLGVGAGYALGRWRSRPLVRTGSPREGTNNSP